MRFVTAAAVVGLALTASLAACSGGNSSGGGTGGGDGALTGDPNSGDITWWSWTPETINAEKYIAAFNEEYPDIKVTYKQTSIDGYDAALRPAIQSASGPDVFAVTPGSANGGAQVFGDGAIDLAPVLEKALGSDWKDKLAGTSTHPTLSMGDKFVGIAGGSVYSGTMWINQDIFDKYGLKAPTTLDEWKSVCQTLESNGQGCFVHGAGQAVFNLDVIHAIADQVHPGLYVDASEGKAKWNDPDMVKSFEIFKSLFDDKIMQDGALGLQQYPDANNLFMSGKYAMIMMGTWYTQNVVKDTQAAAMEAAGVTNPQPFAMVPIMFPDVAGTGNTGALFGDADYALAVSAKSKNQAAAATFATWLGTSEAGQQIVADILNNIPSLKGIEPNWDNITLSSPDKEKQPILDIYSKAAASSEPRLATVSADLNTAIQIATTEVAGGQSSPQKACDDLQAKFEAM